MATILTALCAKHALSIAQHVHQPPHAKPAPTAFIFLAYLVCLVLAAARSAPPQLIAPSAPMGFIYLAHLANPAHLNVLFAQAHQTALNVPTDISFQEGTLVQFVPQIAPLAHLPHPATSALMGII